MDILSDMANALSPTMLLFALIGAALGTLVGVLPGLGPSSAIAILLPIAITFDAAAAMTLLIGVYYGAMYGGSTTAILMNIPGEVSSVPTALDGFQLTKKGRGGAALAVAAVSSFIAGTFGIVMLAIAGPWIAGFALKLGAPEYFVLVMLSLLTLASLSGGSLSRGVLMALFGIVLGMVGFESLAGLPRLTFGSVTMLSGFDLVPVVIGLFGIAEVLASMTGSGSAIYSGPRGPLRPRRDEVRALSMTTARATGTGFVLGALPGMIPAITSFIAYDVEKRVSKDPKRFGKGALEGVAAPEAANNATAVSGMIPMMSFGIPGSPTLALLLAGLVILGLQPGPLLFSAHAEFTWTVIGAMFVGNTMLLILNLPLVGMWARLAAVPYRFMVPVIVALCLMGAYATRNSMFDVFVAVAFGCLGVWMRRLHWPVAPVVLGMILGPMLEQHLLASTGLGSVFIFFQRPGSLSIIIGAAVAVAVLSIWRRRRIATREEMVE